MRFFQYIASRYIVENHEKIEQNRRFYRDLAHDYRFDKSQLIADFLPISRTWEYLRKIERKLDFHNRSQTIQVIQIGLSNENHITLFLFCRE